MPIPNDEDMAIDHDVDFGGAETPCGLEAALEAIADRVAQGLEVDPAGPLEEPHEGVIGDPNAFVHGKPPHQ